MEEKQPTKAPEGVSKELQKRVNAFNEKVTPLLTEFRLGISAQPVIMPDGRLGAIPIMVDADQIPKGKPAQEQKKPLAEA